MRTGVAALSLTLLLAACQDQGSAPSRPTPSDTADETTPEPATTSPAAAEPPPWAAAALPQDAAPAVLAREWERARGEAAERVCPALAPESVEGLDEATPRAARFGSDSWAVAWDWPGRPGTHPTGEHCEDCGRGVFGVAGNPVSPEFTGDLTGSWPNRREWADGSAMGWGLEGGQGPKWLTYLSVAGAHCSYNVWSLSEEHLLALVASLRFVEGLGAP